MLDEYITGAERAVHARNMHLVDVRYAMSTRQKASRKRLTLPHLSKRPSWRRGVRHVPRFVHGTPR